MPPETTAAISIPRPLAMRLMQIAQLAGDDARLGVVGAGADDVPDAYFAKAETEDWSAPIERMKREGRQFWAVLAHRPDLQSPVDVIGQLPEVLCSRPCLITSLEIRGVLQLRAWTLQGSSAIESNLRLLDD